MNNVSLHRGDCLEVLHSLADNSVDAIVTDPPYGLSFMGKKWDYDVPSVEIWAECLRVLKPGGHLLAFAGTRTQHRMATRIEDAGFEIRDMIAWCFGSGFPKSLDVSKAIDKARDDSADILRVTMFMADAADRSGVSRADVDARMGTSDMAGWWLSRLQHRCQCPKWNQWLQLKVILSLSDEMDAEVWRLNGRKGMPGNDRPDREVSGPAGNDVYQPTQREVNAGTPVTEAARQWQGWGTALKPALEPITVARKPLVGTVASNVLEHGTGALNIDGCRVPAVGEEGRWPANLIHDGSDEVLAAFPVTSSHDTADSGGRREKSDRAAAGFNHSKLGTLPAGRGDSGSAARFFYCSKASRSDRNEGLGDPGPQFQKGSTLRDAENLNAAGGRKGNHHPTVKPTDLMRYLCRLVTPPGGVVLDPFMGSGSTGRGAVLEGFGFIGIERDEDENGEPLGYMAIAEARIAGARRMVQEAANDAEGESTQGDLFGDAA